MSELELLITQNQQATALVLTRARSIPLDRWTIPREPGKWSPAQVVEHITKSYEGHRQMAQGLLPATGGRLKQWLARTFFLPQLFRVGDFTQQGLKAPKFLEPSDTPAPPEILLPRYEAAAAGLESDLLAAAARGNGEVVHTVFGRVSLADLLHFVVIHTRHHEPQIVAAR
ncbi:MAG TPA: DinB family protein [Gemmatimonadales bacterium]|nr:DinB family protein [Gemmatimonadales bacterium]